MNVPTLKTARICLAVTASLALVAFSALDAAAQAPATEPEVRTYMVQPGDSVWSIAERFYGSGDKYKVIYKYNKFIGRPPYLLKPGQILRLPVGAEAPEAHVNWLKRDVQAKPPRALDWLTAREKMNLWRLYKVATGDESAVHIVFEDRSDLRLRDNALLVIYGGSAKKTAGQTRPEKTRIVLEKGSIRGGLPVAAGVEESMSIETPSGNVEIFGHSVQIDANPDKSAVSVYDGKADMSALGTKVSIPKDFGTIAKKGKKPEKPRPLPPAPDWDPSSGDAVVFAVGGNPARIDARWQTVKTAATYRVELGRDAAFTKIATDVTVGAGITRVRLADIAPGSYFVRVSARDKDGLEGHASKPLSVTVKPLASSRRAVPSALDGVDFEVVGFSLFQPETGEGTEMAVEDGEFGPVELVPLTTPGIHTIRTRQTGSTAENVVTIKVLAVTATLTPPPEPLDGTVKTVPVTMSLVDERGRRASLPGIVLDASPGGRVPLTEVTPGKYTAEVATPRSRDTLALRAAWAGGVLDSKTLAVQHPKPPELDYTRYVYPWVGSPWGIDYGQRHLPTALAVADAQTRLGVRVGITQREAADRDPTYLTAAVGGELALADDRLALDAQLDGIRLRLRSSAAREADLGDLQLGVRYLLLRGPLSLAPNLRVTVPLLERDNTRVAGFEPGVLLRWAPSTNFYADMRQAAVIGTSFGDTTEIAYTGTYALSLRPFPLVSLTAAFDSVISLSRPTGLADYTALSAGGALHLYLGRVRLGASFGVGLNADAKRELGVGTFRFTLDVGRGGP